jgi:5-methylcytosine-specific restriction enzyme A
MRLCPGCGTRTQTKGRCRDCRRAHEKQRGNRHRRGYTNDWQRMVKAAIAAHPFCTDCGSTSDLTGDHIVPLSQGGLNVPGNIAVRCRSCNSARGNRGTDQPRFMPLAEPSIRDWVA